MTILQALSRQYDRLTAEDHSANQPPKFGYSLEKISYVIVLSSEGLISDVLPSLDYSGAKPKPFQKTVPQAVVRTSKIVSNFLWDKTAYVFGVKRDTSTDEIIESVGEHEEFINHNRKLLQSVEDGELASFLKFLRVWQPSQFHELPGANEILDTNVVFKLEGNNRYLHENAVAEEIWMNHLSNDENKGSPVGQCLVTGAVETPVRIHPRIKGVRGAQSSGASIISFNLDAFESYGKEQGSNAPVSQGATFAYTAALNYMLDKNSGRCVQIGDTTTVFWAETGGKGPDLTTHEDLFSMIIHPRSDDDTESEELSKKLNLIAQGRPLSDIDSNIDEDTRFYILGLSPNASRLSIRFWIEDSFGNLYRRAAKHFEDLIIEPVPWKIPPAPWRLLKETAAQKKLDNIEPTLSGALMRSILEERPYPRSLFGAVITRIRADKEINGMRAAICKAFLARNYRFNVETEDVSMSLDKNETSAAYRLGRMFAVYEGIQRAAQGGNLNSTIKDQYFGAASATPASVFPIIVRKAMHHLSSIKKDGKGGLARWFESEIESILDGMNSSFPKSLRLEDQGRFVIGYYHQASRKRNPTNQNKEPISLEESSVESES